MYLKVHELQGLGQELPEAPSAPAPGPLEQLKASWEATPQWKRQAVITGMISAATFFWMSRLFGMFK